MPAIRPHPALAPDATHHTRRWHACAVGAAAAVAATALGILAPGLAGAAGPTNRFTQRNLVSDVPGMARITDPNLVNAWGLAFGPKLPVWVADNGRDVSTLYTGAVNGSAPSIVPLVVGIPGGAPTGAVFNGTSGFTIRSGGRSAPARFIFDSEAGRVTAWSPSVGPMTRAQTVATSKTAVYKGLALASTRNGMRLFATDFHNDRIDVFNDRFGRVSTKGAFTDRAIPRGYAPFNVQTVGRDLVVTYARQDKARHDDAKGAGHGFVDVYRTNGQLVKRLVTRGALNSPWGVVVAPRGFGSFGGDLLIGNFGNGAINAYDMRTGAFQGALRDQSGKPIRIDGLWALRLGNGTFGARSDVVFSAGPNGEMHGLLGQIVVAH